MEIYLKTLELLEGYFNTKDWKKYFLYGGCYWLANYLYQRIGNSVLMINRMEEHMLEKHLAKMQQTAQNIDD